MRVALVSNALAQPTRGNHTTIQRWIHNVNGIEIVPVPAEAMELDASPDLVNGYHALNGGLTARLLARSYGCPLVINLGGTDGTKIAGSTGGVTLNPFAYHTTIADMEMDGQIHLGSADSRWHRCSDDYDGYDSPQHNWIATVQGRVPPIDTAGLGLSMMLIAEGIFLSQKLGREVTPKEVEEASVSTAVKL